MIYLNGKTEKDYNANYIHWECTAPEPKLDPVEVPMRDGLIYCNEMLSSRIFFKARTITAKMELRGLRGEWPIVYSQILQDLHGKEVEVERSEDPGWIWTGHAVVGPLEEHGASAGVTITITAQPFKQTKEWQLEEAIVLSGDEDITIDVPFMRGYPEFTASTSGMTVTYEDETWSLPSGSSTANGLILFDGENELTLHGSGTMTVRYKGGQL